MMFSDVVAVAGAVELVALAVVLVALVRPKQRVKLGLVMAERSVGAEQAADLRKVA